MIFLGVDPGLSGALAEVNEQGILVALLDIPTLHIGKRQEYDRGEIKRILSSFASPQIVVRGQTLKGPFRPGEAIPVDDPCKVQFKAAEICIACVELVHAMPGQGVVSMWRMGQGFELWMMALTMLGISVETVTPQRWKGTMLNGLPKDKDASRYRAKQLWPEQAEQFARKKDDGRAEAALIAEYLRRQWVKR